MMKHVVCQAALAALLVLGTVSLRAQDVHVQGIDSLQLRANVQAQFNTTSVDDEPETAWLMRRARIGIRMFAAGWIRADVEGDFGRGTARLTDGFVRLDFAPAFRIRAGQYKKPFDTLELVSSRETLTIERDGLPRGASLPTPNAIVKAAGYSDRDIGAEWSGVFDAATVTAGFWNGERSGVAEDDDGKQVAARVEIAAPHGWRVAGAWAAIRRSPPEDQPDVDGVWSSAFEVAATAGKYAEPGWKALVQGFAGEGEPDFDTPDVEEPSFLAFQAIGAYHIATFTVPHLIGVEPLARFGWADPDTDVDDDETMLWTAGVNLYHHKHVKTQIQVDHVRPSEGSGETAGRVQLAIGF